MKKIILGLFPIAIFLFFTATIFRPYFLSHKVPLPGNLLVAFYQPWKSYPIPNYPNGPANKPIGFDSLRIFYPFRALTTESLKKGHIPLWNKYTFSGNIYLAAYQTAVFSPVDIFFFIFPLLDAWSLMVIVAPFLTALSMYWFLRTLTLSRKASIIGALTFGFAGIVIAFTEEWYIASYGILFLPLIFLAIYKLQQKTSMWCFILLILSFSGSILSGWFQITFYTFIFVFFWTLFLLRNNKNRKWVWYVIGSFILAILLCGVYLIPNIEAFFYSARSNTDAKYIFDMYLLPISRLLTYVIPDYWGNPASYNYFGDGFYQEKILYVGITGILFGLYSLTKIKQLSKIHIFFLISWLIFLSLGFSLPTSWVLLYYLHIPLLQTLVPSRIIIMAAFCLAIVGSYGFELYWKERKFRNVITLFILLGLLFPLGWIGSVYYKIFYPTKDFFSVSLRNTFLPLLFLTLFFVLFLIDSKFLKKYRKISYIVFLIFTIVPLFLFANKYLYFSERQFTFPTVPVIQKLQQIAGDDRVISFGPGYIESNLLVPYKIQSPEGYDSFFIEKYGELITSAANEGKFTTNIARANVNFEIPGNLQEIAQKNKLMKIWSLLGVRYLVGKENPADKEFTRKDPQKHFSLVWTDGTYAIYKNNSALPRAFLVPQVITEKNPQQILETLYSPSFNLSQKVIVEKDIKNAASVSFSGYAAISQYETEKVGIKTTSTADSFLVLSDNYYQGWNVYVDGKKQEILRADFSLRTVMVPKGSHTVVFVFDPLSYRIGFWLSCVGFVTVIGLYCYFFIKNYKKK